MAIAGIVKSSLVGIDDLRNPSTPFHFAYLALQVHRHLRPVVDFCPGLVDKSAARQCHFNGKRELSIDWSSEFRWDVDSDDGGDDASLNLADGVVVRNNCAVPEGIRSPASSFSGICSWLSWRLGAPGYWVSQLEHLGQASNRRLEPDHYGSCIDRCWPLPTYSVEKPLSWSLSITDSFFHEPLARWRDRRSADGRASRTVLSGLLLGLDASTDCSGDDESSVDGVSSGFHLSRKGYAKRGTHG